MTIDFSELEDRMKRNEANSIAISTNGTIRVIFAWGTCMMTHEAFDIWLKTGRLTRGAESKFKTLYVQPE